MSKKYAFWKTETGQPHRGDDDKYAPKATLKRYGETATPNEDGSISWPSLEPMYHEQVLKFSIAIVGPDGKELNETDTGRIVTDALKASIRKNGGKKPIIPSELLRLANSEAAEFFRNEPETFTLLTSLSIKSFPSKMIRIGGCRIAPITAKAMKQYTMPALLSRPSTNRIVNLAHENSSYARIKITTQGRTAQDAVDRALDAASLLRGLWTIPSTIGHRPFSFGGSKREPIGAVYSGPIHTLHRPDGSSAVDVFWYHREYTEERTNFVPRGGWALVEKWRRQAQRKLARHPFQSDIESLIIRYESALNYSDLDVTFLQMWSILEKVTDTIGKKYEQTVNRSVWLFKERDVASEALEQLRTRRNQLVHSAKSGDDTEQAAYSIKLFVEAHLVRLIFNSFKVQSLREYAEFLDQPTDIATLQKRRKRHSIAIRFHSPKRAKSE